MRIETRSEKQTQAFAKDILKKLMGEKRFPLILALSGNLGSGKTVFAKGVAEALGITEKIQSPTFVLMKWYDLVDDHRPYETLIHIDAYRLDSLKDAKRLGFSDLFHNKRAIIVIEWADRMRELIPKQAVWIKFKHGSRSRRLIEIQSTNIARPRLSRGEAGEIQNKK